MSLISQEMMSLLVFAGVAASTYGALVAFDPYWSRVRSRVSELQGQGSVGHSQLSAQLASQSPAQRRGVAGRLGGVELIDRDRTLQRLSRAGCYDPNAVSKYLAARIICTLLPPVVTISLGLAGMLRMDWAILVGCILGGLGTLTPGMWLERAARFRQAKLRSGLPDFLDLMIVCLEGGMSLQETIRRVGDELRLAHPELAMELRIVQRDIELGATVDQSLKRFATRSDYEGVRSLSTFIRETQRFGTNITEALRSHADVMRTQREQAAEERAQKASVKILVPTMLFIFPTTFVVLVGPAAIQIYQAFGSE
jgi:tight adherence protein C